MNILYLYYYDGAWTCDFNTSSMRLIDDNYYLYVSQIFSEFLYRFS